MEPSSAVSLSRRKTQSIRELRPQFLCLVCVNRWKIAAAPGLAADDVEVDIEKSVLTLSGERKVEKEDTEGTYRRVERQYGSLTRSFSLPETVDADSISADLKDGVLELRLPKKEAPTPRKISVNKAG